jgi:hypothetical protein
MDMAQRGKMPLFDVTSIKSTRDEFSIEVSEVIEADIAEELRELLAKRGAFSEALLLDLLGLIEEERRDAVLETMDELREF